MGSAGCATCPFPIGSSSGAGRSCSSSRSSRSGLSGRRPQLERRRAGRPLPAGLERFLRSPRPARHPRRDLGRPARPHLPDRADRRAVVGAEPRADLHLRDLLARARAACRWCSGTSGAVLNPWLAHRERGRVDLADARAGLEAAARVSGAARALAGGVLPPLLRGYSSSSTRSRPARGRWRSRSRSTATRCGSAWPPTGGGSGTRAGTASPSTSACSRGSRRSASTRAGSSCGCRSPVCRAGTRRRDCWRSSP